jgi:hypothetical protein
MNKEFIPYEQALALKELGFNEPCLAHLIGFGDGTIENGRYKIIQQQVFYPNDYTTSNDKAEELGLNPFGMCGVPLFQQSFRFFREKYKKNSYIAFCEYGIKSENSWYYTFDNPTGQQHWQGKFKSYEEAELECLKKLIKIVKQTKKD